MSSTLHFRPNRSGRFRERLGPVGPKAPHSSQKLCVVATDLELLADLLYGISLRNDCCYVKYGAISRAGMYLGRVFLTTDEAASELCQELKAHPRLMVSLQDDAAFSKFRERPLAAGECGIYDEWTEHEAEIDALVELAFGRTDEAKMVAAVRAAGAATISLMAQAALEDPAAEWPIVGHVLLSPVRIAERPELRGLGLAPLAVAPDHRRRGVGARLVHAALRRARLLGYQFVVVLGDPAYYGSFGLVPAANFGLSYGHTSTPAFLALELSKGALERASGAVSYHPAFSS